jgi:hypothetical protein
MHVRVLQFIRETFWIAISRKVRPAMSNCVEYISLHQRYAQALTSWLRAANSPDTADDKAAEQERDATFRALSEHTVNCRHCTSVAG